MTERTLFDSPDDGTADIAGGQEGPASHLPRPCAWHATSSSGESRGVRPTDSLWRECKLEEFVVMSETEQLDYCARRDEDSARFADTEEDAAWYRERAAWYRNRMKEL